MKTSTKILAIIVSLLITCVSARAEEMNIIEQFKSHVAQKQWTEALPIIEEIIERKPEFATSWRNYGVVLDELGRHADAAKAFRRAYELKPDDYGSQFRVFRSLELAGDVSGFLAFLEQEAKRHPNIVEMVSDAEEFTAVVSTEEFRALAKKYR